MTIQRFTRWVAGHVRFAIFGVHPAKALDLAAKHGIALWDTQERDGMLTACADLADYRRFCRILRKENQRRPRRAAIFRQTAGAEKSFRRKRGRLRKRVRRLISGIATLLAPDPPPPPSPPPPAPFSGDAAARLRADPTRIRRPVDEPKPTPKRRRIPVLPREKKRRKRRKMPKSAACCSDLRLCAALRGKDTWTLRVLQRHGIRFFLHRYRKRVGLPAGLALCAVLFCLAQGYVWDIEVHGNTRVPDRVILSALERNGLQVGMAKDDAAVRIIAHKTLLEQPALSWMAINLLDCRAVVEVGERTDTPEMLAEDAPCNLVASADGQITGIYAFGGQNAVKVGDSVAAGDLLVSGIFVDFSGGSHYVHAFGEVWAEVPYELTVEVPLGYLVYRPKDTAERQVLTLPGGEVEAQGAMTVLQCRQAQLFGVDLPASVHRAVEADTICEAAVRTEEEAAVLAQALLDKRIRLLVGSDEILRRKQEGYVQDGIYRLETHIVALRNIAKPQPILVETTSGTKDAD